MNRDSFVQQVLDTPTGAFILRGDAGTGKTHTAITIIKQHIAIDKNTSIAVVAPSHKAKENFKAMLKERGVTHPIIIQTVAKFLGKRPDLNLSESQIADAESFIGRSCDFVKCHDLIIIDEFGMLSERDAKSFKNSAKKRLFVGDEAQLPNPDHRAKPINIPKMLSSAQASIILTKNYRIKNPALSSIIQTAKTNPKALRPTISYKQALSDFLTRCARYGYDQSIAFLCSTNRGVEQVSAMLSNEQTISHNSFDFNFQRKAQLSNQQDYTITNGARVVFAEGTLYKMPTLPLIMQKGYHTPFNIAPKTDANRAMFNLLSVKTSVRRPLSHPQIPFVRVYNGTSKLFTRRFVQPIYKTYRDYVQQLQKKYKLDNPNEIWQRKGTLLTKNELTTLNAHYSDLMFVKNILCVTDARVFTCYKAQGSSIDVVYTQLSAKSPEETYVACSRASQELHIVGGTE